MATECSYSCMQITLALSMGGNVLQILLQNEPIFTKRQEKKHSEGKQIWNFSYLIIFFWYLAGGILEPLYPYYTHGFRYQT